MSCSMLYSIQHNQPSDQEDRIRWRDRHTDSTGLADTGMVPVVMETSASRTATIELATRSGDSAIQDRAPSAVEEASVDGLSLVRDSLLNSGLSEQSTSMILSSWRVSTKKQYISYLHRWITFCADCHLNFFYERCITHLKLPKYLV